MNKKEIQEQINYVNRFLERRELVHLNCIRLNPTCSDKHNNAIYERCKEYIRNGTVFLTEARFTDGSRCDILLPAIPLIEEILVSETDERFDKKKYPFRTRAIRI